MLFFWCSWIKVYLKHSCSCYCEDNLKWCCFCVWAAQTVMLRYSDIGLEVCWRHEEPWRITVWPSGLCQGLSGLCSWSWWSRFYKMIYSWLRLTHQNQTDKHFSLFMNLNLLGGPEHSPVVHSSEPCSLQFYLGFLLSILHDKSINNLRLSKVEKLYFGVKHDTRLCSWWEPVHEFLPVMWDAWPCLVFTVQWPCVVVYIPMKPVRFHCIGSRCYLFSFMDRVAPPAPVVLSPSTKQ